MICDSCTKMQCYDKAKYLTKIEDKNGFKYTVHLCENHYDELEKYELNHENTNAPK